MNLENQLELCSNYYRKWKNLALSASDAEEAKKCFERAFFWLELHSAYLALWAIEQTNGSDPKVRERLFIAKLNLCKKLTDYTKLLLNELKFKC